VRKITFYRNLRKSAILVPLLCLSPLLWAQAAEPGVETVPMHLQVETGTPLRLYTTKRVWYRKGDLVQAKTADATWAFDRIVMEVVVNADDSTLRENGGGCVPFASGRGRTPTDN
jgi:hypothetical protein